MLYTNATILTMEGRNFESGYLQTEDRRIAAVGPMKDCPEGEAEDLSGKTVVPGFIDSHCHLGLWEGGLGFEGDDTNEDTDPVCPHIRALDGINPMDGYFEEALRGGITTAVVSPGSANPIGGEICAIKTGGKRIDSMLVKSPLGIKLALGENPKMSYHPKTQAPVTRMATAALIREQLWKARRYMEDLQLAQEDEERDAPEYDAKCEALLPLLRGEIQAHIHAHKAADIFTGIRIAEEFGLDYVIIHGTEAHLVSEILSELNARVICGPLICARSKPELMNQSIQNCAKLMADGIQAAICTDHPEVPIGFLKLSARVSVENGLDQNKALEALTILPARICRLDDRIGSLKAGKDADFLVFDGNPMDSGREPEQVYLMGKRVI